MTTATGNEQAASNDTTSKNPTLATAVAVAATKAAFPEAVVTEDNSTDATTTTTTTTTGSKHPVLYLHGFPGAGLEGALFARQVAAAGGMLFALDRPGFGGTDPPSNDNNEILLPVYSSSSSSSSSPPPTSSSSNEDNEHNNVDDNILMEQAIQDMWDVITKEKWTEFSLIGVSGGGLYTLCFLNSYLEHCRRAVNNVSTSNTNVDDNKTSSIVVMPPKLRAISLVAARCLVSKPEEDMTMSPNVKAFHDLVASQKTSWWSRFKLHFMTSMTAVFITYIPTLWYVKLSASISNPQLPPPDQAVCRNRDKVTSMRLVSAMKVAMQQGSRSMYQEACALFPNTTPCWLLSLQSFYQQHYQKKDHDSCNDDDDASLFDNMFPNICIFPRKLDANVPVSNAVYMLEHIFFVSNSSSGEGGGHDTTTQNDDDDDDDNPSKNNKNNNNNNNDVVKLKIYDDLGHISLLTTKTSDIARFAVLSSF